MNNINTITFEFRDMFYHYVDCIYSNYFEGNMTLPDEEISNLQKFQTRGGITDLFREGYTYLLVPHSDQLDLIEQYHQDKVDFIIIINKDGKLYHVVNGVDVWY